MKYILVTGVSTGIGEGVLKELVDQRFFVFGTVRKKEDAERLKKELPEEYFTPLLLDVTHERSIDAAVKIVAKKLGKEPLYGLVNNAGILTGGPVAMLTLDQYREVMEVNFFGIIKMIQAFLPLMSGRKNPYKPGKNSPPYPHNGKIINISSVLGHYGLPYVSTYAASKYALEGFCDSARRELAQMNIQVVALIPGAVKTLIFKKAAKEKDYDYARGTIFEVHGRKLREYLLKLEKNGISPQKVGKKTASILNRKKAKPRYVITGSPMMEWLWPKYLPDRMLDFVLKVLLK